MAQVKITDSLLERTASKINQMMHVELKLLGEFTPPMLQGTEQEVLEAIWGKNLHLKDMIPPEWCSDRASIKASVTTNVPDTRENAPAEYHKYYFDVKFNNSILMPPKFDYWKEIDLSSVHAMRSTCEYADKHYEVAERWAKVKDKVMTFLRACKSLNEAIKLWADVEFYIDDDDLNRLGTKTADKDSRAAEILASMDTDELVGAAVIARMAGAK